MADAIPDLADAVDSPVRLTTDEEIAARILAVVPTIPTPVWGRDEAGAGEMWNSNSVIAWVLSRSGVEIDCVRPPPHGRAPGWNAGLVVAADGGVRTMSGPAGDRSALSFADPAS